MLVVELSVGGAIFALGSITKCLRASRKVVGDENISSGTKSLENPIHLYVSDDEDFVLETLDTSVETHQSELSVSHSLSGELISNSSSLV